MVEERGYVVHLIQLAQLLQTSSASVEGSLSMWCSLRNLKNTVSAYAAEGASNITDKATAATPSRTRTKYSSTYISISTTCPFKNGRGVGPDVGDCVGLG